MVSKNATKGHYKVGVNSTKVRGNQVLMNVLAALLVFRLDTSLTMSVHEKRKGVRESNA